MRIYQFRHFIERLSWLLLNIKHPRILILPLLASLQIISKISFLLPKDLNFFFVSYFDEFFVAQDEENKMKSTRERWKTKLFPSTKKIDFLLFHSLLIPKTFSKNPFLFISSSCFGKNKCQTSIYCKSLFLCLAHSFLFCLSKA